MPDVGLGQVLVIALPVLLVLLGVLAQVRGRRRPRLDHEAVAARLGHRSPRGENSQAAYGRDSGP